jgi:amino acid transporter
LHEGFGDAANGAAAIFRRWALRGGAWSLPFFMTTLALPALRPARWWRGLRFRRSTLGIALCLGLWCVALGLLTQVRAPRLVADLALGTPAVVAATLWLRRMRFDWATILVIFGAMVLWGFLHGLHRLR